MEYALAALCGVVIFLIVWSLGPLRDEPTDEELLREYEADYRDERYGAKDGDK
jgi:hypothetical protein